MDFVAVDLYIPRLMLDIGDSRDLNGICPFFFGIRSALGTGFGGANAEIAPEEAVAIRQGFPEHFPRLGYGQNTTSA